MTDPLALIAIAGLAVSFAACALQGWRGVWWTLAIGLAWPLLAWLFAVAGVLLEDEGRSDSSKFTIYAGFGMGVTLAWLAWVLGGLPGAFVGVVANRFRAERRTGARR